MNKSAIVYKITKSIPAGHFFYVKNIKFAGFSYIPRPEFRNPLNKDEILTGSARSREIGLKIDRSYNQ